MGVRIRLQRKGRKKMPYYYIVVADSRVPRDGKFIERLGSYNPNTNPATIQLDAEKALEWLYKGAQPTDTARAILSYKGVMYKKHLLRGVAKGVLTLEQADEKFAAWIEDKAAKITAKIESLKGASNEKQRARLTEELAVANKRKEALDAKIAEAIAAEAAANAPEEPEVAEEEAPAMEAEATAEVEAEAPAPAAEPEVEAPAEVEVPAAEPTAEAAPEAPAEEPTPEA